MLTIKNVSNGYTKNKPVIKDINLHVPSGTICGFIGPNGSGKSTTIKTLIGILPFKQGEILINGINLKEDPLACKQIMTYVQDNPEIYPYLTGQQYLDFIGDIFNIPIDARQVRITELSHQLKFDPYLNQIVSSYSHGTKQKLAIIGALIPQPKLLVLDEPFVGLDPEATNSLRQIMRDLCDQGSSVFFSTHILEVAQKLCDRIVMIKDGQVVIQGETEELVKNTDLEQIFLAEVNQHEH